MTDLDTFLATSDIVTLHCPLNIGTPGLPNLLLTPHSAYYSEQAREEVRRRAAEQILAVLRGEQPAGIANPTVFEQGRLRALRDR